MGQNTATIKYLIGSLSGNTLNVYIFGSAILTTIKFLMGVIRTRTIDGAIGVAVDYYVSKLTPFPLNEFLTASGVEEVLLNVLLAVGVGAVVASYRYHRNRW